MAKAAVQPAAPAASKRSTVRVTYRPLEHAQLIIGQDGKAKRGPVFQDPASLKWNGITFHANVPVELDPKNKAHGYLVPMPKEIAGANGEVLTKHRDTWVSMIDLAKDNPSFEVEGFPRAKVKKSNRLVPAAGFEWANEHEDEIYEEDVAAA